MTLSNFDYPNDLILYKSGRLSYLWNGWS